MIKVHFTNIEKQIIDLISSSQSNIKISVAWFTNKRIFYKILEILESQKSVELMINNDITNNNRNCLDFEKFLGKGGKLYFIKSEYFLHHKFMIIDDKKVMTGSYNYTEIAESTNIENIVVIENENQVTEDFMLEFERLKRYCTDVLSFEKNDVLNSFQTQFKKIPEKIEIVNTSNSYETFQIVEFGFDIITIRNLENEEIFTISSSDLPEFYEENDFLKIKTPLQFAPSIITKNNFLVRLGVSNLIENPEFIQ